MFLVDNCNQYSYTKINVPIILLKPPSDYKGCDYYFDVNCDSFCQENCYIGVQKVDIIKLSRVKKADCEYNCMAEWALEMIVTGGKSEREVLAILNELCIAFSLKYVQHYKQFRYFGFGCFSYDRLHLKIKYAYENKIFGDTVFSMCCGPIEIKTTTSIDNKIFKLTKKVKTASKHEELKIAFLRALKSKDRISRYILLYYLFELMYKTKEYQNIKEKYKKTYGKEKCKKDRNIILFQYLQQEFNLKGYRSFGKNVVLNPNILENIILTRNDLTHRGDYSNVSELMYGHLLPILQTVIEKIQ